MKKKDIQRDSTLGIMQRGDNNPKDFMWTF